MLIIFSHSILIICTLPGRVLKFCKIKTQTPAISLSKTEQGSKFDVSGYQRESKQPLKNHKPRYQKPADTGSLLHFCRRAPLKDKNVVQTNGSNDYYMATNWLAHN